MVDALNMSNPLNMIDVTQGQNFLIKSNDLSYFLWNKQGGTIVTPNADLGPKGTGDAWLVDATTAGAGQGVFQGAITIPYLKIGDNNCKSVWLKGFTGTETVRLRDPAMGNAFINCPLNLTWQRFSYVDNQQNGFFGLWIQKIIGNKFYFWNAGLNLANHPGPDIVTGLSAVTNPILNLP
jgi:hypothetical protein